MLSRFEEAILGELVKGGGGKRRKELRTPLPPNVHPLPQPAPPSPALRPCLAFFLSSPPTTHTHTSFKPGTCQPDTSTARAGPSPPGPSILATHLSYLMTIAPPPGGPSSPPLLEGPGSFMIVSFFWTVAILPWLRPLLVACRIFLELPALILLSNPPK